MNRIWHFLRPYLTASKLIVYAVVAMDVYVTNRVIEICCLAIKADFTASMPYLAALIAFIQAVTGTVIGFYLNKSKAENTQGGITYDMAMSSGGERDG